MPSRYDRETKAKAIRLVRGHAGDYQTEWAAICAISARLGMSAETLRTWMRQAEVDAGARCAYRDGTGDPRAEAQERRA